jgi:hypothetical protein
MYPFPFVDFMELNFVRKTVITKQKRNKKEEGRRRRKERRDLEKEARKAHDNEK